MAREDFFPHQTPVPFILIESLAKVYVESNFNMVIAAEVTGMKVTRCYAIGRKARFQAAVRKILTDKYEHLELSPDRVLQETAAIAYAKVSDIFDEQGDLIAPYMLPAHVAATISAIEIESRSEVNVKKKRAKIDVEALANDEDTDEEPEVDIDRIITRKYKFHDKNAALERLARHYKIVGGQDEGINALASALADRLKAARTRLPSAHSQPIEDARIIDSAPESVPQPVESDDEIW